MQRGQGSERKNLRKGQHVLLHPHLQEKGELCSSRLFPISVFRSLLLPPVPFSTPSPQREPVISLVSTLKCHNPVAALVCDSAWRWGQNLKSPLGRKDGRNDWSYRQLSQCTNLNIQNPWTWLFLCSSFSECSFTNHLPLKDTTSYAGYMIMPQTNPTSAISELIQGWTIPNNNTRINSLVHVLTTINLLLPTPVAWIIK